MDRSAVCCGDGMYGAMLVVHGNAGSIGRCWLDRAIRARLVDAVMRASELWMRLSSG